MGSLAADEYRRLLEVEAGRLSGLDPGALDQPLPHIEGWTVQTVVGHVGWIFRYVARCLQAEPDEKPSRSLIGEPPSARDVLSWFDDGFAELSGELANTDLTHPRPTFTGPQPAVWWLRRVSHEVAMHRWDAFSPSATPEPIDAEQARDGIDEVLEVFAPNRLQFSALGGTGETIHLHATDIEAGEWLLELGADEVRWERSHAKGDVAARAPSSDLLLLLWGRIDPTAVEVFGRADLLDRWQQAAAF